MDEGQGWTQSRTKDRAAIVKVVLSLVAIGLILALVVRADEPATDPETLNITREERFLSFLRERIPGAASKTDQELIAGGQALCARFDRGLTIDQVAVTGAIQGFDFQEMGDAIVASVNTFCPEHKNLIE